MTVFTPPPQRAAWQRLQALAQAGVPHLRELLAPGQAARHAALQWQAAGLRLDASRQAVTPEVLDALLALADESGVLALAEAQRRGEAINATEGRAALHVALRGGGWADPPWGGAVAQAVQAELDRFLDAAERLRDGRWRGHRGARITDVVNIGIGGSDLGPRMAVQALDAHVDPAVRVHFVSNPDAWSLHSELRRLRPDHTVFVVQSKTFTTQETMTLAASARRWLADGGLATAEQQTPHLIAVTAAPAVSAAQGYAPAHTFGFWDWVGGRYSVWSAIGLPLAVAIGAANFREFLAGAHAMDRHFWEAPPARNLPLVLALLGVWNRNFLGCPTHLVAAYAGRLFHFARYLQQLDMESNGKSTHVDGQPVQVATGPIVWGGLGIEGQHAYFQLLHQGQHRVPVDFIGVDTEDTPLPLAHEHHRVVLLNLRAQADALALGRPEADTLALLERSGLDPAQVQALLPHRTFRGNVPSNTLWLPALTPHSLGALTALYEHKVFCQAALWGIHPYDQWGVELGKTLAQALERQGAAPA
ncbi:glucose-6-phosphate isomerase [Aquabacterium sp. A08]|uniref:glucose-6-phosphate isomerase n=1 Tax=Aquabacterium sp. A08 TaxID=2718532 RepID=UPI00141E0642|nr:glucose-6-phosphate isomerase [Aquabacterium sp. A08]NIC42697.1 glucose-6-phosphate isomerase [Aquabacterium sp. A08]